ncbi:MAG: BamA/TamA family outer membrane protein, partial [Opitutales bacterium]|nr:BamA/TamA family outer membrane protein [Opitutales bacterium]
RNQEGKSTTSLIGQNLTLDLLNSRQAPTDGVLFRLNTDLAGLGGDAQYVRAKISGSYYYQVATHWVVNIGGEVGHIQDFGEEIKINDRFFLGGDNLRGFEDSGVGPRVSGTEDSLGGRTFFTSTAELSFPLGLPEELGFSGAIFTDIGTLLDPVEDDSTILNVTTPRVSAGLGLKWRSPFGPIRLDVALPVVKEDFDKEELFRFNFGTRF